MKDNSECEQYQDALDRHFEGAATDEDIQRLREHAGWCPDCATLLRMREHLEGASLSELEAAVPDQLVEGMWPRVELELMRDERRQAGEKKRSPVWRWVVATQAAAIVLLAAGATYLYGELGRIRDSERVMSDRMAQQERQLEVLDWRTTDAQTTQVAQRAGSPTWQRRLGTVDDVTVAEMTRFLESQPSDSRVLDARAARKLISRLPYALPGTSLESLATIRVDDGLQAGEALALIAALELEPSQRLPAGRIAGLSQRYD